MYDVLLHVQRFFYISHPASDSGKLSNMGPCWAESDTTRWFAQIVGFNVDSFGATDFKYLSESISFVYGPGGKRLPFPDHTFDLVMSMNVLEHVEGGSFQSDPFLPSSRTYAFRIQILHDVLFEVVPVSSD